MKQDRIARYINNRIILITGGTGSFGEFLVKALVSLKPKKIIIFSREEWKQYRLRDKLLGYKDILDFRIGDVRNLDSLLSVTRGVDLVYHAAAMKHVPICEENPMEAVYTNTHGAYNLKEAAIRNNVKKVVAISTDKAVRSVNVMGMTKAIQERIFLSNNIESETQFVCVRFGNVVGSRGSVVPFFKEKLEKKEPLPLTDARMTRFLITLKDAMELVFTATLDGKGREIFVKKMPACNMDDLAQVMIAEITHDKNYPIKMIGLREGEQLYEALVSEEEMRRAKESEKYFIVYPHGTPNLPKIKTKLMEYRTDLIGKTLTKLQIRLMLKRSGWI